MKKLLAIALALCALCALAGCGGDEPAAEPTAEPVQTAEPVVPDAAVPDPAMPTAPEQPAAKDDKQMPAVPEQPAAKDDKQMPAVPEQPAVLDQAAYDAAKACIGQPVDALYAAIGQPDEATYGTSCLQENAEDGSLAYNALGFSVWTVRDAQGEIVHDVLGFDE